MLQMEMGKRQSGVENGGPRYRQLDAWRYSDDLAVEVYHVARKLPPHARVIMDQIIRAAVSAPANIAEGYGRVSSKEFRHFLTIAHASLYEVSYFLHFLRRIEIIDGDTYERLAASCQRASRVTYDLMRAVRSDAEAKEPTPRYLKEEPGVYAANGD